MSKFKKVLAAIMIAGAIAAASVATISYGDGCGRDGCPIDHSND